VALSSPLALVAALAALAVPAGPPARAATAASAVPRPHIIQRPIPFGTARRRETAAYARRHYGLDTYRLRDPKVIVEHVTVTDTFSAAYNTFAPDRPDAELGELPGTCAHFVVDRDGTIYQLVPIGIICRHTVGLNWTAIGIENVGRSDADVLGRPAQVASLVALTRWLRCREGIGVGNVIGHAESLSSPYHRERVARLRRQTHGDFVRSSMRAVRARLRAAGACAA
jgi:N-acetyl-anhydromuramyl-L-alanine amidase AmpD